MSAQRQETVKRVTAPDIAARKGQTPVVCLTAYTTPVAEILDAHCDLMLVGDSVGMVLHGLPNTVGVTMEMMILHGQAVMRGAKRAMVVVDMPFGSYEASPEVAFANAVRILKETGCQAVKVEAGPEVVGAIEYLVKRGVPVMGHVGLRPQATNVDGGFKAKGRGADERKRILSCGGHLGCRQVLVNQPGRGPVSMPVGPCRVWYQHRGETLGLAMSRSLGDSIVHKSGVSAEPECIERVIDDYDDFLILATDGVWDVVDNNYAVQLVQSFAAKSANWSPIEATNSLCRFARSRWEKLSPMIDDISCIVVKIHR